MFGKAMELVVNYNLIFGTVNGGAWESQLTNLPAFYYIIAIILVHGKILNLIKFNVKNVSLHVINFWFIY
jgi:hypothetical protein